MSRSLREGDLQFGALPYRKGKLGVEVLLITSRETKRWIIPKGWPMAGKKPHRAAQIEAFQEAGVKGIIAPKAVGSYSYPKILADGTERACLVEVYPLLVTIEATKWREQAERERAWFTLEESLIRVDDGGLGQLIAQLR
jgi:8-oxo-dGTP pyrophosphatase MutT (NUDIX family)